MRFVPLDPSLAVPFAEFLAHVAADPDSDHFRPHGMDRDAAEKLCRMTTHDFYAVMVHDGNVIAYGFLRGWEDGWAIPSLGIAVRSDLAGMGVGKAVMSLLHLEARLRATQAVRLRVHPDNSKAMHFYVTLGYKFGTELDRGQSVGILDLLRPR